MPYGISYSLYSRDQIDLTCEILKRVLGTIPVGHALSKYEDLFLEGLAHSESRVKELIFQEVYYIVDLHNKFNDLLLSISVDQ